MLEQLPDINDTNDAVTNKESDENADLWLSLSTKELIDGQNVGFLYYYIKINQ